MIAIFAYIYNGKGKSKSNKKFTFQYNPYNKNNHPNPIQYMFPMLKTINEHYNLYPLSPKTPPPYVELNEQYNPPPSVELNEQYNPPPSVELNEQYNPSPPPRMPLEQMPLEQMLSEKMPLEKMPSEKVSMEKMSSEKVYISESNQKTESNIHNCEDNYIWNKYLKKCITTECPLETDFNCDNRSWVLPYQIIAPNPIAPNVPTNVYNAGMGGLSPGLVEKICETLNIPVPEEGETCWSECQHRYTKTECPEMTMEECTAITPGYGYNDSPLATTIFTNQETCEDISKFTAEYQLKTLFWDTGEKNAVLPGEICWSAACQKCVKPTPLTRSQGRIKHNQNPSCFPNNQTCQRDVKFDAIVLPPSTGIMPVRQLSSETCQEWSTFTEWGKYELNPAVLPGEVCWSPCTGKCVVPIDW